MQLMLKDETVKLNGVSAEILVAICQIMAVWHRHGVDHLTITSAPDGKHIDNSLHYSGNAVDIRTRTLPDVQAMVDDVRRTLRPEYDILLYETHLHVEYDPKPANQAI